MCEQKGKVQAHNSPTVMYFGGSGTSYTVTLYSQDVLILMFCFCVLDAV